ncbi:sulfatase, putative [Verrucomicrobiia bacterium DG1235]|nr:sulfatase, putative [Verrucomicrobiae bacterium DG1235]
MPHSTNPILLLALAITLHHTLLTPPSAASSAEKPPNIVFIFADDLGYNDLSSYGATDIATPAIDSLGEQGIRFTDFYSASPVCSPSRAALLTGRYPIRQGITGVFWPQSFDGIDPAETTIAELLQENGYRTGLVGKWHLGHHQKHLPLQNGFHSYFGIPYSNDMDMVVYMRGNDVESYEVDQHYTTRRYTEEAVQFIEQNKDQPFFLYLAHSMPHVPIYASENFVGTSKRGLYGDVIQELDWSVAQILDTLDKHQLSENTLVVFTSDNGPWTALKHLGGSAAPLREGKMFTFDGGMRVPCLVRWPAQIPAGQTSHAMANMMDWFPTFSRIANLDTPKSRSIDGLDITDVLTGSGPRADNEFFFFHGDGDLRAYRDGDWKLKLPYEGNQAARWRQAVAAHPILLFNLAEDPGETTDLAAQHPERLAAMQARMTDFLASLGELPPEKITRKPGDESHYKIIDAE